MYSYNMKIKDRTWQHTEVLQIVSLTASVIKHIYTSTSNPLRLMPLDCIRALLAMCTQGQIQPIIMINMQPIMNGKVINKFNSFHNHMLHTIHRAVPDVRLKPTDTHYSMRAPCLQYISSVYSTLSNSLTVKRSLCFQRKNFCRHSQAEQDRKGTLFTSAQINQTSYIETVQH